MQIGPTLRAMQHNRTRLLLIVTEVAITLAIVTNCVSVILAERSRMTQQSGFDDDNLVRLRMRPFAADFRNDAFVEATIDRDVRTMEGVPGVVAAANTTVQLWEGGGSSTQFFVAGAMRPPVVTQIYFGTQHFVQTTGGEIVEGRGFEPGDYPPVGESVEPTRAIITKTLADLLFPDGHAVGQTIQQGRPDRIFHEPVVVIGVLREFYNPFGRPTRVAAFSDRAVFLPARVGDADGMLYLIRCRPGTMRSVIEQIDQQLTRQNAGRVLEFSPVSEQRSRWFASNNIVVTTLSCIIVALVTVTALGLLGLTSLSVTERTRQIGTRRALGATRRDILLQLMMENWFVTSAGLLPGIIGAYALNVVLVTQATTGKLEWPLVAAGAVLLWVNALVATLPPAWRATLVPPSIATRTV